MPLLQVTGLGENVRPPRVVDGVDFQVDKGEIVGLLGPNGAGKTTSFRMTCGIIEPEAGRVVLGRQRRDQLAHVPASPRRRHGLSGPGAKRFPQAVGRKKPAGGDGNGRHGSHGPPQALRATAGAIRHQAHPQIEGAVHLRR